MSPSATYSNNDLSCHATLYFLSVTALIFNNKPIPTILAIKELWNRGYGKAKEHIEHSGDIENPVIIMTPEEQAIAQGKKKK